jgi:predicted RNase H-like HicB family nuclease
VEEKMSRTYTVALLKEADGRFTVVVPALPGCYTMGRTITEALEMTRDAIACHLEALAIDGDPIPEDKTDFVVEAEAGGDVVIRHVVVETQGALVTA